MKKVLFIKKGTIFSIYSFFQIIENYNIVANINIPILSL